jgi:hypothetical protein
MVQHGLRALAATLSEGELTKANCSVAIVGKNAPYVVLEDDDVEPYLQVGVLSFCGVMTGRRRLRVLGTD